MAIQDDLDIVAQRAAFNFNKMWSKKSIHPIRKNCGTLYALAGDLLGDKSAEGAAQFERVSDFSGNKVEHRMLMQLDSPTEVSRGSAEVARVTPTYNANRWGNMEWDTTQIPHHVFVPHSDMDAVSGAAMETKKFEDFQQEYFDMIMLSYQGLLATRMWEANAPADNKVGGLPYAITDAASDESSYAAYGKFDRADAAHADFVSKVYRSVGNLTYQKIKKGILHAHSRHCALKNAFCGVGVYAAVDAIASSMTRITYDEKWTAFGGEWVQIGQMKFILDGYATAGMLIGVDPTHFRIYRGKNPIVTSFVNDPSTVASYVIQTNLKFQMLVRQFTAGVKWKGINEISD